jgi:fermentation-respiration switch protein FrsA (DUF1100 family)
MATPKTTIDTLEVDIPAGDITLAGVLRVPDGGAPPRPGLVLTGPFTGVKEQVVGRYAAALASAGFVTLAFDHRNFGASGGRVRQHEDSAGKLDDLRHATSYLAAQGEVDEARMGCVGICLGGGYALKHSAFDPRIRALAAVAAAFNDPRAMRDGMGADAYRGAMASFAEVDQRQFATGETEYVRAVADDPAVEAAMPGAEPFEYYGTSRSTSPGWVNRVTRLSIRELLTFDAAMGADFLEGTPALVVHGRRDDFCSPAAAEAIHARLTGPKELVWLDTTNHIDLYDQAAFVDPAVNHVAHWMTDHL